MKYIIGIGTNTGNRKENIKNALDAFSLVPKTSVLRTSSVYETEPVGYANQDNFYNLCAEIESELEPPEMLGVCLGIEAGLGRVRKFKNGPRIIDLDVILAENKTINTKNLTVPHPRFKERKFVLVPLSELFEGKDAYGIEFESEISKIKGQKIKKVYSL